MKTKEQDHQGSTVAAVAAPEDLRRGDFVAVLSEVVELPSFLWCDVSASERGELVRIRTDFRGEISDDRHPLDESGQIGSQLCKGRDQVSPNWANQTTNLLNPQVDERK